MPCVPSGKFEFWHGFAGTEKRGEAQQNNGLQLIGGRYIGGTLRIWTSDGRLGYIVQTFWGFLNSCARPGTQHQINAGVEHMFSCFVSLGLRSKLFAYGVSHATLMNREAKAQSLARTLQANIEEERLLYDSSAKPQTVICSLYLFVNYWQCHNWSTSKWVNVTMGQCNNGSM